MFSIFSSISDIRFVSRIRFQCDIRIADAKEQKRRDQNVQWSVGFRMMKWICLSMRHSSGVHNANTSLVAGENSRENHLFLPFCHWDFHAKINTATIRSSELFDWTNLNHPKRQSARNDKWIDFHWHLLHLNSLGWTLCYQTVWLEVASSGKFRFFVFGISTMSTRKIRVYFSIKKKRKWKKKSVARAFSSFLFSCLLACYRRLFTEWPFAIVTFFSFTSSSRFSCRCFFLPPRKCARQLFHQ